MILENIFTLNKVINLENWVCLNSTFYFKCKKLRNSSFFVIAKFTTRPTLSRPTLSRPTPTNPLQPNNPSSFCSIWCSRNYALKFKSTWKNSIWTKSEMRFKSEVESFYINIYDTITRLKYSIGVVIVQ